MDLRVRAFELAQRQFPMATIESLVIEAEKIYQFLIRY